MATLGPPLGALILIAFGDTQDKDNLISVTRDAVVSAWKAGGGLVLNTGSVSINYLVLTSVVLYGSYLLFPLIASFEYKRDLFFPGAHYQEVPARRLPRLEKQWAKYGMRLPQGTNVYKLEDELFNLLEFAKRREPRIDAWMAMLVFGVLYPVGFSLFSMLLLSQFGIGHIGWARAGVVSLIILSSLAMFWLTVSAMRRRQYR